MTLDLSRSKEEAIDQMDFQMTKDLAVTLEDRPGTLFKACDAVAKAGINIEGYCGVPTGRGEATFHLVTNDPAGTRRALEGAGLTVREERDALLVGAQNRPGFFATLLRPIADAGINVGVSYSLVDTRIAITADNTAKLQEVLRAFKPAVSARP